MDYLELNEVQLSKRTGHIGKKDCFTLNSLFDIVQERYQSYGRSWSQIKGLENVSSIGSYKTSFIIDSYQTEYMGAYLDLGMLSDTFRVNINEFALPMTDQFGRSINIGSYLKAGENIIEVQVATT